MRLRRSPQIFMRTPVKLLRRGNWNAALQRY